ncbi:hypothetical protein, partial [Actinoplanes philippinensis]|uniref:flagellin N-terminal helical domain-containing protein n=1 Tax=Actinoplanes philippinensis TaxID=35752 RepID=UPI0033E4BF4B
MTVTRLRPSARASSSCEPGQAVRRRGSSSSRRAATRATAGSVTERTRKSLETLSSGFRINRAADDAAGLSI